eukprot:Pgem_evm1s233
MFVFFLYSILSFLNLGVNGNPPGFPVKVLFYLNQNNCNASVAFTNDFAKLEFFPVDASPFQCVHFYYSTPSNQYVTIFHKSPSCDSGDKDQFTIHASYATRSQCHTNASTNFPNMNIAIQIISSKATKSDRPLSQIHTMCTDFSFAATFTEPTSKQIPSNITYSNSSQQYKCIHFYISEKDSINYYTADFHLNENCASKDADRQRIHQAVFGMNQCQNSNLSQNDANPSLPNNAFVIATTTIPSVSATSTVETTSTGTSGGSSNVGMLVGVIVGVVVFVLAIAIILAVIYRRKNIRKIKELKKDQLNGLSPEEFANEGAIVLQSDAEYEYVNKKATGIAIDATPTKKATINIDEDYTNSNTIYENEEFSTAKSIGVSKEEDYVTFEENSRNIYYENETKSIGVNKEDVTFEGNSRNLGLPEQEHYYE